jgi:hypothetical protein
MNALLALAIIVPAWIAADVLLVVLLYRRGLREQAATRAANRRLVRRVKP